MERNEHAQPARSGDVIHDFFNTEFDVISDMSKIRQAGFVEPADNKRSFSDALANLRKRTFLP